MIKVSIIVPVYNVEQYLRRCVDSLLSQTLEDIEIILINDASPDNSHLIMQEYEKAYAPKVKCIYLKEHLFMGGARNKGIELASGEYLTFVDSDDGVEPEMCEKLYNKAKEYNSDIVFCDYDLRWEATGKIRNKLMVANPQMGKVTSIKLKSLLFADHYPWAKLIRRSIILNHQIYFPENKMYEDIPATRFYLLYSERIDKVNICLYHYYQRATSVTNSMDSTFRYDEAEMAQLFYDECIERGFMDEYSEEIKMLFLRMFYLYPLHSCLTKFTTPPIEYMRDLRDKIKAIYPDYRNNKYINREAEPLFVAIAAANDISPERLIEEYQNGNLSNDTIHYFKLFRETQIETEKLFMYCKKRHWNIALWGAGQKGKDFLEINDTAGENISLVIDLDSRLQGTVLKTGHRIVDYQDAIDKIDIILIINHNYYGDIRQMVIGNKVRLFDLDSYLMNEFEIEEWLEE
jgi:glycosyltransferase involved in cell wall biosynthesis